MKWEGEFGFITMHDTRLTLLAVQFKACSFQQAVRFQIDHFAFLAGGQVPNEQSIFTDVASETDDGVSNFCTRII